MKYECVEGAFSRENESGVLGKLNKDFPLQVFHPLGHFFVLQMCRSS